MLRANKTINTKVGLDLPMSEQVRQRQVTLNEVKTLVNGGKTLIAAIVATGNGTGGSNFHV